MSRVSGSIRFLLQSSLLLLCCEIVWEKQYDAVIETCLFLLVTHDVNLQDEDIFSRGE